MHTAAADRLYICPGEVHPISRAVHLSRLAAFYPACRDCPFRTETGQLPRQVVEQLQSAERRVERPSLFTDEGVRGVYLNELNRARAAAMASAFAALLWDEAPLVGRTLPVGETEATSETDADALVRTGRRIRPVVVVGRDDRPAAPDIHAGVVAGLRRMGCQIIDIGLATKAGFWFAVDHLQAAGGILVTGAGCDPSWIGLDFAARGALPLSKTASGRTSATGWSLNRLEARLDEPCSRQTRHAGTQRSFLARVPYEAGLWKHFHALRPLKVACASANRLTSATLGRLFEALPCRLVDVRIPQRARSVDRADDPDVERLGRVVCARQADVGILIDEDGQRCGVADEAGTLLTSLQVTRLIAGSLLHDHPGVGIALEPALDVTLRPEIEAAGGTTVAAGVTLAAMSRAMREQRARFGSAGSRYWFHEAVPTSDAVLTLAHLLVALSRTDLPVSELVRPIVARV